MTEPSGDSSTSVAPTPSASSSVAPSATSSLVSRTEHAVHQVCSNAVAGTIKLLHKPTGELTDVTSVERHTFMEYLLQERTDEKGCAAIPFCFLLLLSFTFGCLEHEGTRGRQALSSAIRTDLIENANFAYLNKTVGLKYFEDVHSVPDFWQWFEEGFLPVTMSDASGEYLQFNKIIGGFRLLRQQKHDNTSFCNSGVSTWAETLDLECMDVGTNDALAEGYDDLAYMPQGEETAQWSTTPFDGTAASIDKKFFMLTGSPAARNAEVLRLKNANWINKNTRHVQLSMVVFNADFHLVCLVELNFFFARTGRIWKMPHIQSFDPDILRNPFPILLYDAMWLFALFYGIGRELVSLVRTGFKFGLFKFHRHLAHGALWYAVDFVGITCGMTLIGGFYNNYGQLLEVKSVLVTGYQGMRTNPEDLASFLSLVENVSHHSSFWYRFALVLYPLQLMMRVAMTFTGQPRLSMFTTTIQESWTDLYHYLIIFSTFMMAFACAGHILFGREVENFSSMSRSVQSLARMLFGDLDWEEMRSVGWARAVLFFVAFHCILVLIMFNILLAVIIDAYENAQDKLGKGSTTVAQQVVHTLKRWKAQYAGECVSLNHIWSSCVHTFGKTGSSDRFLRQDITDEDLIQCVDGIPKEQALKLIRSAVWFGKKKTAPHVEITDILHKAYELGALAAKFEAVLQERRPGEEEDDGNGNTARDSFLDGQKVLPQNVMLPGDIGDFSPNLLKLDGVKDVLAYLQFLSRDAPQGLREAVALAETLHYEDGGEPQSDTVAYLRAKAGKVKLPVDEAELVEIPTPALRSGNNQSGLSFNIGLCCRPRSPNVIPQQISPASDHPFVEE